MFFKRTDKGKHKVPDVMVFDIFKDQYNYIHNIIGIATEP